MHILGSIVLTAILTAAILLLLTVFIFRDQLTNTITLADMKYCERKIKEQYRVYTEKNRRFDNDRKVDTLDVEKLAQSLRLQMKSVPSLKNNVRAHLDIAPDGSDYNGVVSYVSDGNNDYQTNFDIIHEIMHYLHDVGYGRKVTTSFARTNHGDRRGYHEQMIDYYAAAVAIPKDNLQRRIMLYGGNPYDDDFINELVEVYNQPKVTVKRRISEVLALS